MSIKEIPAKLNKNTGKRLNINVKKRVCGYARVSTNLDEQKNSYRSQLEYYVNFINENPDWKFIGLYADEGISGTKIENRAKFNEMIEDAKDGKIDMIITKSISRFARNTVDSLKTIRELRKIGIDVYFERENFHSLGEDSELFFSIISGISQEESHSISENTKWGIRKRYKDGVARRPYRRILGYNKDENGNLIINQNEVETVKFIFDKYIDGYSTSSIANKLNVLSYKNVNGKCEWNSSVIIKILRNETYKGKSILQKYFSKDFISKTRVLNTGEFTKYEINDDHEGIINGDLFDCVQYEIKKRGEERQASRKSILSCKLFCGKCKAPLARKTWFINDKKVTAYVCKDKKIKKCHINHFLENDAKEILVYAINFLIKKKNKIINKDIRLIETNDDINYLISKSTMLEKEIFDIRNKLNLIISDIEKCSREIGCQMTDKKEKYDKLNVIYESKSNDLEKLKEEIIGIKFKNYKIKMFIECLKKSYEIEKFNEEICAKLIDKMYIYDGKIEVIYVDGMRITI